MGGRDILAREVAAGLVGLYPAIQQELLRRKGEQASKSLHHFFVNFAWPVLQPGTPFQDNWHLHAMCEHLEAVSSGQIKRLIINLPFRMLKSSLVSQAWPAWEWINQPHLQYLTASYAKDVSTRDAVDSRRIIESDGYQLCFGDRFAMTSDQNVKTRFENDKRGQRIVTSTDSSGTGFGGNRVLIDDPISSKEANNEAARLGSIEWYKGTAATRLNNPKDDAMIIVHQRLHEKDLTGHILAEEKDAGWEHLILPMRFEEKRRKTTVLGFKDPRKKDGELLFPARLDEKTVKAMEATLGGYHTSAQLQQNPNPRGGIVLNSEWFGRYVTLPKIIKRRIYGDTAQKTKERNDYSVFEMWGLGDNGKIYLLDVIRGKWEAHTLLQKATDFWNKHLEHDQFMSCPLTAMKIEDKASGTGLVQTLKARTQIPVHPIPRSVDKLTRAYDGQPYIENGSVCIPKDAPWVSDFCAEVDAFTKDDSHDHDDQIDPMLDAIQDLLAKKKSIYDVL